MGEPELYVKEGRGGRARLTGALGMVGNRFAVQHPGGRSDAGGGGRVTCHDRHHCHVPAVSVGPAREQAAGCHSADGATGGVGGHGEGG